MALTKQDLQEISLLLNPLQSDMQDMKQDMQGMKQDMQEMKQNMQDMSERITALDLHIENETDRNIRLLAENHIDIIRKLNNVVDAHTKDLIFEIEISDLKTRVKRLEDRNA